MATTKKQALDLIRKLPERVTWDEIMYELYVRQGIEVGLRAADAGKVVPHELVKKRLLR